MDPTIQYLTVAGLAAVTWFGVPGAGDAALVAASILGAPGKLDISLALISAVVGAVIGGAVGYVVGVNGGRPLVLRPGPFLGWREKALAKGDRLLQRFGRLASLTALPLICGVNAVPLWTFVPFSTIGRLGWVLGTGLVAYFLGEAAVDRLKQIGVPVVATIVVLAAVVFGIYYLWSQRHPKTAPGD